MKKIISIISVLAAAASLTACNGINSPAGNISDNSNSSQSTTSSQSSMSSQSSTSSEESSLSDDQIAWMLTQQYLDLKGEELIAKFEWPYDDPIDLDGMTAKKIVLTHDGDTFNDIQLSDLSNEFRWYVECDYGYLAMSPEKDGEYEYKKYKAGDKIGDLTVTQIRTFFDNTNFNFKKYFVGVTAQFEGEITLVGKCKYPNPDPEDNYALPVNSFHFIPDEESSKKLPIVHFIKKIDLMNELEDYQRISEVTDIYLGEPKNYPNIDFSKFPRDGSYINVKVTIKNYGYRAMFELPFFGSAEIADLVIL